MPRMEYASIGNRIAAVLIDGIIISFIVGIAWTLIGASSTITTILYFAVLEGSSMQATLGKKVVGIKVVDSNGNGISIGEALIRSLCRMLSGCILGIGYFMALWDDNRQALHDKLAGTYVVTDCTSGGYVKSNPPAQAFIPQKNNRVNPCIIGISGQFAGSCTKVDERGIIFGRDRIGCQMAFGENTPGISRHHCAVSFNPITNMFIVNDLGSTYGTFLENGTKILQGQPIALKCGERFCIASPMNMFEVRL
ncbi:MAG: hypothetical protein K0S71_2462 [Clostridia bacterium]|jgi:hypothetical protein|nr:hypothetical protein [Clostridia bacterium]